LAEDQRSVAFFECCERSAGPQTNDASVRHLCDLTVSVIIPTRNRPEELSTLLTCLSEQTVRPREIIVIDDSDDSKTEQLVRENAGELRIKRITLSYARNENEKSLTIARNLGVSLAKFEIIMFLDDDVELYNNYLEEVLKVYARNPAAVGVQGYFKTGRNNSLSNAMHKVFYLSQSVQNKWQILPSGQEVFPIPLTKTIDCPRLSGANHSYRKQVFKLLSFDETLKGYGFGEDKDFSYRVSKKYPKGLYCTPNAKLIHKESTKARLPRKSQLYMESVNDLYFFYKNIPQTLSNKAIYAWSRIGLLIAMFTGLLLKSKTKAYLPQIAYLLSSYLWAMKHSREIKTGNLSFADEVLRN